MALADAARADRYPIKRLARAVGVLYLAIFLIAPFPYLHRRAPASWCPATRQRPRRISRHRTGVFRAGLAAESVVFLIEIAVSAMLFVILRPVSAPVALAATFARLAEAVIQAANLLTGIGVVLVLGGAGYLAAFGSGQLDALAMLFLDINAFGILLWGMLFGFHLVLLGSLTYRSGFWPRALGVLLLAGRRRISRAELRTPAGPGSRRGPVDRGHPPRRPGRARVHDLAAVEGCGRRSVARAGRRRDRVTERLRLAGGWARTVAVGLVVALVMTSASAPWGRAALEYGGWPSVAMPGAEVQDAYGRAGHRVGYTTIEIGLRASAAFARGIGRQPQRHRALDHVSVRDRARRTVGSVVLSTYAGSASRDEPPDRTLGPRPRVLLSLGFAIGSGAYAWLAEHLASHGFVVIALEHREALDPDGLWRATVDRPSEWPRC